MEIFITTSVEHIQGLDGIVEEQDTWLLLNPETAIRESHESYHALVNQMQEQPARELGEVIVKAGTPVRLLAVIYDLEREPVCQTAYIKAALSNLMAEIRKRRIRVIAMPLLGTTYGPVNIEEFIHLLTDINETPPEYPELLWLIVPPLQYLQVFATYLKTAHFR